MVWSLENRAVISYRNYLYHKTIYTCTEQLYSSYSKGENNPNVHPYNGIVLKYKKQTTDTSNSIDELFFWMNFKKQHANCKKPDLNGLWLHLNQVREKTVKL